MRISVPQTVPGPRSLTNLMFSLSLPRELLGTMRSYQELPPSGRKVPRSINIILLELTLWGSVQWTIRALGPPGTRRLLANLMSRQCLRSELPRTMRSVLQTCHLRELGFTGSLIQLELVLHRASVLQTSLTAAREGSCRWPYRFHGCRHHRYWISLKLDRQGCCSQQPPGQHDSHRYTAVGYRDNTPLIR